MDQLLRLKRDVIRRHQESEHDDAGVAGTFGQPPTFETGMGAEAPVA
jgi:hypothetical protein